MALSDGLGDDDSENWEPLATLDYVLLIVASLHQVLVLGVVVHLVWCRSWPPYVVKNVPLVCVTGIAGVINMVGVVISKGFLDYSKPSFLSNCFLHGFMTWTGSGLYYGAAVVRVYRNYRVLIHHNADMMQPISQIMVVQMPIWLMTFPLLSSSVASMNYETNRCDGHVKNILLGAFNYAGVLLLGATYLLWEMRHVRKQMNEYRVMMMTLGFLMVSVVVLDATAGCYSSDETMTRRVALMNNFVRSAILFWPIIFTPLLKYAVQDAGYAERFAMGKERTLTPTRLRASLSEQLRVDEIWVHFRKIAEEKMDPAFPSFYKVVMDRDSEQGYLKRQAKTMDIIDTYIADNATMRLRVSDGVRARILASEVTRDDIFQEAANEVLSAMREKCEEAFRSSGVCAQLLSKHEWDKMESPIKAKGIDTTSCTGYGARNASCDNTRGWWYCIPWSWCLHGRRRSTPSLEHKLARGRHGTCIVASASGLSNGIVGSRSNSARVSSPAVNMIRSELKGPSSVPRLDDEDIERGNALATDGVNSRTPSVFKEGRPFGAPTTATTTATESAFRTSMGASPSRLSTRSSLALSSSLAFSSAESSPLSLLLSRSDVTSNPSSKRLPPVPWAPWRRTPEPAIAPSLNSPSSGEEMGEGPESYHHEQQQQQQQHFNGDEKAVEADVMESGVMTGFGGGLGLGVVRSEAREDGDILFSRGGVVPSSSKSSVVLLMPPSPATPQSTGSSLSESGGGSVGRCRGRRVLSSESSLAAVEEARDGDEVVEGGDGVVTVNGPRRRYSGGQSWIASLVGGWRGNAIVEEKDASSMKVEVEESYESCAEFAAATGFVPTEGFVPSTRLLEVAMAKEGEERKRAEVARSLTRLGTLSAVFSDVEEDEEDDEKEVSEESWEDRKEEDRKEPQPESEVEAMEAEAEEGAQGYWEFQVEEARRVPQEVSVSTVVKGVKADRQGSPFSSSGDTERMESGLTCFSSGGSSERGDVDRGSGEVVPNAARAVDMVSQSPKVPVIPPSLGVDEESQSTERVEVVGEERTGDKKVGMRPRLPLLSPPRPSPPTSQPFPAGAASRPSVLPVVHSMSPSPSGQSYQVPDVSDQSAQVPEVSDQSRSSSSSSLSPCPPSDAGKEITFPDVAMAAETGTTHNVARRKEEGIERVESSCRKGDRPPSSSFSTAPGESNPSGPVLEERDQDHPPPKTPPRATSVAGGLERKAPPRMATRDRALVVAAARAKVQAQMTQLSAVSQVGKGSGPACAQPARAPPWGSSVAESLSESSSRDAVNVHSSAEGLFSSGVDLLNPSGQTGMQCPLSPPPKTPPPPLPPPLLPLNLVAVGAPSHVTYAPPSPSGWSNSGSPSSVKSSPVFVRAHPPCHHPHYNQQQQQAGTAGLPPAVRSWREGFTTSGTVASLAWSWSDSTLSGCSRSGGFGGGMSSVSASVCSEYTSPLVGMKFVEADAPEDGGSSSVRTRGRSRSTSTSGSGVLGVSELPLMGVRGSPPLLAVERSVEGEAQGKGVGSSKSIKPAVSVSVSAAAAAAKGRDATGSEAKRRRRFFFP